MDITYLGHSAFEIVTNESKILIDPFLVRKLDYVSCNISDIFVTHGHGDHVGSSISISQALGTPITAIFELANYCASKGAKVIDMGLGSWSNYKWGRAILVPAFHSSSSTDGIYTGCPCGVILEIEGKKIYHAGDTCLTSEMKTIGEVYKPEIVMLPVGGKYTMDIEHASIAAEWLGAQTVIPMHYNTFDAIRVNIQEFDSIIKGMGKNSLIMNIGQKVTL